MGSLDAAFAASLGAAVLVLLALWLAVRSARDALAARLAAAERELAAIRARPETREFRIEAYNALWYPVVTPAAGGGEPSVNPGTPHCPKCALRLRAGPGDSDWTCDKCGHACPNSAVSPAVTDQIGKTALSYFNERRR